MRKCNVCGTAIPDDANYCPNCRQKIKTNNKSVWYRSSRLLIVLGAVVSLVSNAFDLVNQTNVLEPAYGSRSDVINYDNMITLSSEYPKIAADIQPYYDYMQTIVKTFHKSEEDAGFDYSITISNDTLSDVWMSARIADDQKGSVLPVYLNYITNDYPYELSIMADYYNIEQADMNDTIYIESYAIAEVLGIQEDTMKELVQRFFNEMYINYYRPTSMDVIIEDVRYQLDYSGEGDLYLWVRKSLTL